MLQTTIYVYLVDEGTDVWRPVEAAFVKDGVYQINPSCIIPETETWQFGPGDTVRCEQKRLSGGEHLVAIEKVKLLDLGHYG